jgi:hypothetical protein
VKATFVVKDTMTTKRLFKDWIRVFVPSIDNTYAVYVWSKPNNDETECLQFTSEDKWTNGQYVAINTRDATHSVIDESQISFIGDSLSLPSVCHLLSINKVVHMSKMGQIAIAFLFLLQSNTNDLVELNEENTDVFSKLIPGISDAEGELKFLMKKKQTFSEVIIQVLKISQIL